MIIQTLLELGVFIVSYDIWFYFSHLLLHNIPYLKKLHSLHHTTFYKELTFTDAYVGHYFESPFQSLGFLFPLLFIEFHAPSFIIGLVFVNGRGMLRHDYKSTWLIGDHHILHHKYYSYNFGEYWLDYLFGTAYKA
jgi:lathosterol oxidase